MPRTHDNDRPDGRPAQRLQIWSSDRSRQSPRSPTSAQSPRRLCPHFDALLGSFGLRIRTKREDTGNPTPQYPSRLRYPRLPFPPLLGRFLLRSNLVVSVFDLFMSVLVRR